VVKIKYNGDKTKEFSECILSYHYEKSTLGRKGWHRSDAISCPLEAYWRLTGEVKGEYRTRDTVTVMIGEMAHQVLEKGFDYQEKVFNFHDVQVTIDAIAGNCPIEIKTTRKKIFSKDQIPADWTEQLAIGMSVMDVDTGFLLIINIINGTFMVFDYTMNAEERELTRQAFIWQILSIADAIEKKNPDLLKPRYSDCHWCYYRPSKQSAGCKYYKKEEDKSGY
jgi:hypothetical protein